MKCSIDGCPGEYEAGKSYTRCDTVGKSLSLTTFLPRFAPYVEMCC